MERRSLKFGEGVLPVVSVREHRGGVPALARVLAQRLGKFDGYVQSAVAGNDDTAAVSSLNPEIICSFHELMGAPQVARVVVAVRLHAALMAINAGHYVVHLAYERKGFGAFEDLGLEAYVFNVHDFQVEEVKRKVDGLLADAERRAEYDAHIADAAGTIEKSRLAVLASLSTTTVK
jgi:polysaccharide pyruvyl transferase WcaK-like protein